MPLLSLLDAFALRALLPHVAHRSLDAGEVLMAEGQPADALYLVVHGVLEITKDDPDRPTFTLGRVADGAVLGEMALVLDRPRTATVTALSEVEVLRLDVAGLRDVAALPRSGARRPGRAARGLHGARPARRRGRHQAGR
jgi:CRP-like cAMP-binding protein